MATNKISRWLTTIDEHLEKSFNPSTSDKEEKGCVTGISKESTSEVRPRAVAQTASDVTTEAAWTSTELTPIASHSISKDNSTIDVSATHCDYINTSLTQFTKDSVDDSNDEVVSSTDSWSFNEDDCDDEQYATIPIIFDGRNVSWGDNLERFDINKAEINCHGVFHIQLIKAIRLPEALNSSTATSSFDIQAVLALNPWKGNVRSSKAEISTTTGGTIRVDWNKQEPQKSYCYSMIHNFNNEETPIPQIVIDLVLHSKKTLATAAATLLLGSTSTSMSANIFETYLCSFTINCFPIMLSPGQYIKRWFAAATSEKELRHTAQLESSSEADFFKIMDPLILLELCFQPTSPGPRHLTSFSPTFAPCPRHCNSEVQKQDRKGIESDNHEITVPISTYSGHAHHLFRIHKFWIPAHCAVCSSLLIGRKAHRCEACKLDCCADCLISVDVLYPCGSKVADMAVQQSMQSKLEFRNIMELVAPTISTSDAASDCQKLGKKHLGSNGMQSNKIFDWKNEGIGLLRFRINRAVIFQQLYPPESFLEDILENDVTVVETKDSGNDSRGKKTSAIDDSASEEGDYYVRVSWNRGNSSVRTRTIHQTSKPQYGGEEFQLSVPNYGTEYKIEVIDANNDSPVGCALLSTQMMLLWHYDKFLSTENEDKNDLLYFLKRLVDARSFKVEFTKCRLELRAGVKTGFGLDFYSPLKSVSVDADLTRSQPVSNLIQNMPGSISGYIDVDFSMEEDLENFMYSKGSSFRVSPFRTPEDFSLELVQLHLSRIGILIEEVTAFFKYLAFLMSWKDPAMTGLCMIAFYFFALKIDTEYIGSLPFAFLLTYMLYQIIQRRQGKNKNFWVNREKAERIEADKRLAASVSIHRSIADLSLIIERGRNIRSRELGLPGSLHASVTWSPYHFLPSRETSSLSDYEATLPFLVGTTTSSGVTSNPVWRGILLSDEAFRLRQFFYDIKPNFEETSVAFDQAWNQSSSFDLPILQPVALSVRHVSVDSSPHLIALPWEQSSGAIIIQVRFDNVLNKLLVMEDVIGTVEIPLSLLLSAEKNNNGERILNRWFALTRIDEGKSSTGAKELFDSHIEKPEIFVRVRLSFPQTDSYLSSAARELSSIVAEGMIRSTALSNGSKVSVIGSGINTLNTVGGLISNIQLVQNQLGRLLDFVESALNAFTWVHPHRSFVVFVLILVSFLTLSVIPTRLLIICCGLAPFVLNFFSAFYGWTRESRESKKPYAEPGGSHLLAYAINFLNALPTNEDLRRAYFWEGRRIGEQERQILAKSKRIGRLTRLWKALWFGSMKMKMHSDGKSSKGNWKWQSVFVVVQIHRVIWWTDERHFDEADPPKGFIILSGHAGVGNLSPIDAKQFKDDEMERVVHVFGRGKWDQEKVCFLACSENEKITFRDAVVRATEYGAID